MKRLYWLIQSLFNPPYRDEYNRLGEVEYLARHGVIEWSEIKGEALVKLDKHLKHI